jgi:hypothetical protein
LQLYHSDLCLRFYKEFLLCARVFSPPHI